MMPTNLSVQDSDSRTLDTLETLLHEILQTCTRQSPCVKSTCLLAAHQPLNSIMSETLTLNWTHPLLCSLLPPTLPHLLIIGSLSSPVHFEILFNQQYDRPEAHQWPLCPENAIWTWYPQAWQLQTPHHLETHPADHQLIRFLNQYVETLSNS